MSERRHLQGPAAPAQPGGAPSSADLWAELPREFQTAVFAIHEPPFNAVIYNYDYVSQRVVDCSGLPLGMRRELAWWLHALLGWGEAVSPIALTIWKNLIAQINAHRRAHGQREAESFTDLGFEEWMALARRSYYERYARLPGRSFARNYEHILRRLLEALTIRYSTREWWRLDCWDPRHDARIALREHEPRGGARIHFEAFEQPWLRDAIKWFLAAGLERGDYSWPSLIAYRTQLGHFARFLAQERIDTPGLCADPTAELRALALRYLAFLRRQRSARTGTPLSQRSVGAMQTVVGNLYAYLHDHQQEAAALLDEPRWLELTPAHARFWRAGEVRHRRGAGKPSGDYIEPDALARIVAQLDILAMPPHESKEVMVDGEPVRVAGLGDPQAMRIYLIAVATGRRISEILLMDFDPIEPVPGLSASADEHAFVARLRYQQTKIEGAPNTILVEQAVVNIVREQQRWVHEEGMRELAGVSRARAGGGPLAPGATPRYLFLRMQRNRLARHPYSSKTLRGRLSVLAEALRVRDSQGRLVDFQRTHRLRHTKATDLLNAGAPIHVVQRYFGHLSPEMTMHYAATLASTHEREFLRLAKVKRDGRALELDPRDVYDLIGLDTRTDRILPNGICLLPPLQACERGNACLTCDHFATDASYLDEHEQQLGKLVELIEQRQTLFERRTGVPMGEDNVWLQGRRREQRALGDIITALRQPGAGARAMRGAGTGARLPDPERA